jgi:hypothetical protein
MWIAEGYAPRTKAGASRNEGTTVMTVKRNDRRFAVLLLSGLAVLPATFAAAQSGQPGSASPPSAATPQAAPGSGTGEHKMMGDHQMMMNEKTMRDDKMRDDKNAGCCSAPGQMKPTAGGGSSGSSDTAAQPPAPAAAPAAPPMKGHM